MKSKFLKNLSRVFFSNIIILLAGVLTSLIIPKVMTVSDYGLYKIYMLYNSYLGIISIGFIDGIYLKYGSYDYESLDDRKFRYFSTYFIIFQLILTIIGICIGCFALKEYSLLVIFLSISSFIVNITGYFQQISQITQRFKELSIKNIVRSILVVILSSSLLLIFMKTDEFINSNLYITCTLCVDGFILLLYIISYRDIIFGKRTSAKNELLEIYKLGMPLFLSNFIVLLLLSIDKQVISMYFDEYEYGIYSFSYTIYSLINTLVNAVAMVIYPTLKRMDSSNLHSKYNSFFSIVLVLGAMCLIGYYPIKYCIEWILPKYAESTYYFKVIFPTIIIISPITIVAHNYFKTINKNLTFFIISAVYLAVGYGATMLAVNLTKNISLVSFIFVINMLLWNLTLQITLHFELHVKFLKNFLFTILCITAYYISMSFDIIISVVVLLACLIMLICAFYLKDIKEGIAQVKKGVTNE